MDETIETLLIGVRADTAGFAKDAGDMQSSLQTALGAGADKAGSLIASGLGKAITAGKSGFADLEKTALAALDKIAAQAVSGGLSSLFGTPASSGLVGIGTSLITSLFGLPGRATGGPVSPGRPYVVGEQGPELFVPASAGSIAPAAAGGASPAAAGIATPTPSTAPVAATPPVPSAPPRAITVAISINAPTATEPQALARSSRQVARAVNRALAQAER